jgi:hypothetical protein
VDSITPVSNPGDYEDSFVLPLFTSDSEPDSVEAPRYQYPTVVFMATGDDVPNDPFSTLLPVTTTATEIEANRRPWRRRGKRSWSSGKSFVSNRIRREPCHGTSNNALACALSAPVRRASLVPASILTIRTAKTGSPGSRTTVPRS